MGAVSHSAKRAPRAYFWLLQIVVWGGYGMLNVLLNARITLGGHQMPMSIAFSSAFGSAVSLLLGSSGIDWLLRRVPPRSSFQQLATRALIAISTMAVLASVGSVAVEAPSIRAQREAFVGVFNPGMFSLPVLMVATLFSYSLLLSAWTGAYLAVRMTRENLAARTETAEAASLASQARLEALRYQLNPHFLFNALNSLRALVHEDVNRADRMVAELADFLRLTLTPDLRERVPLSEELAMARNYLSIEKVRFEERLQTTFEVDDALLERQVPPLILNPLVENAVKYGQQTSPAPLRIRVLAKAVHDELHLEVWNTGSLVAPTQTRRGLGFRNVKERLELLAPGRAAARMTEEAGWVRASLTLPLSALEKAA